MELPNTSSSSLSESSLSSSDSEVEYFIPKKRYKSSIHDGLNRSRYRYHKSALPKKSSNEMVDTRVTAIEPNIIVSNSDIESEQGNKETSDLASSTTSSSSVDDDLSSASTDTTDSESFSSDSDSMDANFQFHDYDESHERLHKDTKHSLASLYTAVMLFVMKHSLSRDAFSDLLHLVSSILPEGTEFTASVYKLKESLKGLVGFSEPKIQRFCQHCHSLLLSDETHCSNIHCRNRNGNVQEFYDLRFQEQLKCLFQDESFYKGVTKPASDTSVCDITSGKLHAETEKPAGADIFLTLTMNTDGVAIFSSSKKGNLWPVYLAVNELPVTLRFTRKYLIPCYVFCEVEKPNMLTYLELLTKGLTHLFEKGIEVVNSHGKFLVKAKLLAVSLDLPARALLSNMKQFNGKSACCLCLDEGCTVPGKPLHRYFPYEEPNILRTHQTILRDANKSVTEGKAINGIKGPSVLFALKYVDMSQIFAIDWMHCVLLGVTKALMGFWFSSVNKNKAFFVGDKLDLLNKRLLNIKIPDFVSRRQRPLQEYTHWKATECREWLLHFSVPVLSGILEADAYVHYLLLVTAMSILNNDRLAEDDIRYAEQLLEDFCSIYPQIYGMSAQTMNVHLLRHLGRNCRLFGPLYTHSCFGFESMNSYLKSMVHGTRHVNSQHQGTRRHNEAWRDSLRYRRPDLDRMPGIRRITINNNPMLGDQGAALLAEALKDDLWLKALDMQGNGISSNGAKALLDVLKYNTTLVVLDVRRNPLIDRDLVHAIMEQLMINCNGQDTEYKWIKAEEPVDRGGNHSRKKRTKTLNSSFGRKTCIKITPGAARRRTRSAESVGVSRRMKPISSEDVKSGPGLPWRTAARANRYRGYPPEHVPGHTSLMESSENYVPSNSLNYTSINVTHDGDDEETEETESSMQEEFTRMKLDDSALSTAVTGRGVKVEIVQLRRQINEERLARHKAEQKVIELTMDNKKLREENSRLKRSRGSILDDDSVLESIEASFKQFHEFLDLLRESGLGKLITMAGLDSEGSPFNSNARDHIQSFHKSFNKSNGFSGDISSNGKMNGNMRPKPYLSNSNLRDPVMNDSQDSQNQSGYNNDSHDEAQKRRDELYEKILRDTSNAFNRIGEQNVTLDVTADTTGTVNIDSTQDESDLQVHKSPEKGQRSKIPRPGVAKRGTDSDTDYDRSMASDKLDNLKGPGGEIIMSLSPFDDDGKKDDDDPRERGGHASRVSDFSYGMDSFEQSYVSERGEVVLLGEDMDYPESPSPIRQDSDNDDF